MISFINESRKRIIRKRILREIEKLNPQKILDDGCGINGSFDYGRFKDRISACDLNAKQINKQGGPARTGIMAKSAHAEKLPYSNASFECVIFAGVLPYVDEPKAAVKECFRVLKEDGFLIITSLSKDSLIKKFSGRKDEKRSHTLDGLGNFIESLGFKVISKDCLDFITIPKKWKMVVFCIAKKRGKI